jgi:hypothetical protein
MTRRLNDLWNGRVPLSRVFWDFAVIYGSFANLLATAAALAMIVLGWPALLAVAVHFRLPYNILMIVSVWRSAALEGDAIWRSRPARSGRRRSRAR